MEVEIFEQNFLYHQHVPSDNSASERAIRIFKIKQKVFGLFRSIEGAEVFAIIRSAIDSTIKNAKNVMETLAIILMGLQG
jgi:transposase